MQKKYLIVYILSVAIGILLLYTDYSFSLSFLNVILIVFIIVYPIVLFFKAELSIKVKVFVSLTVLIILFVLASFLLPFAAMSSSKVTPIKKWHSNGYIVSLNKRLDWAGPLHYRYDLAKTKLLGLVHKTIGYAYPGTELNSSCIVEFEQWAFKKKSIIILNKCKNEIRRIK